MTVGELIDRLDVGVVRRAMIRSMLGGVVNKRIAVRIDGTTGRGTILLDGMECLEAAIGGIDEYLETAN